MPHLCVNDMNDVNAMLDMSEIRYIYLLNIYIYIYFFIYIFISIFNLFSFIYDINNCLLGRGHSPVLERVLERVLE